jgi:hypothetical protein
MNQDSAFMTGSEVLARRKDIKVVYASMQRIKRGYYEVTFKEVEVAPKQTIQGQITEKFIELVEEDINKDPASYLWSHDRWKLKKPTKLINFSKTFTKHLRLARSKIYDGRRGIISISTINNYFYQALKFFKDQFRICGIFNDSSSSLMEVVIMGQPSCLTMVLGTLWSGMRTPRVRLAEFKSLGSLLLE